MVVAGQGICVVVVEQPDAATSVETQGGSGTVVAGQDLGSVIVKHTDGKAQISVAHSKDGDDITVTQGNVVLEFPNRDVNIKRMRTSGKGAVVCVFKA